MPGLLYLYLRKVAEHEPRISTVRKSSGGRTNRGFVHGFGSVQAPRQRSNETTPVVPFGALHTHGSSFFGSSRRCSKTACLLLEGTHQSSGSLLRSSMGKGVEMEVGWGDSRKRFPLSEISQGKPATGRWSYSSAASLTRSPTMGSSNHSRARGACFQGSAVHCKSIGRGEARCREHRVTCGRSRTGHGDMRCAESFVRTWKSFGSAHDFGRACPGDPR